jgi:hypothetical protein
VPDKSWSMWRWGTISACCVNSVCYPSESWRRFLRHPVANGQDAPRD